MGNKLGRKRQVVEDKYTRPQGLYDHKDVDHKKLRKLILDSKLAPCYPPGDNDDDTLSHLEECPICFLYYPSLNRSRCCTKGICTECFLQMKTPNSNRPTQCPFCKASNYAVEYRGMKTKEEKCNEEIEEQRVIEANIRMRKQELQEEGRTQKRYEIRSSSSTVRSGEVEHSSIAEPLSTVEGEEIVSTQQASVASSVRQPSLPRQNREDEFDLDLEDIMVMEAIWLSIQEDDRHRNQAHGDTVSLEQHVSEDRYVSASMAPLTETEMLSSSPSGGLACAIAALAERQQVGGNPTSNYNGNASYNMHLTSSTFSNREEQMQGNYLPIEESLEVSSHNDQGEGGWMVNYHESEEGEFGTSYERSGTVEDDARSNGFPQHDENESSGYQTVVPESFEEQMMLAMAVSLADARARTSWLCTTGESVGSSSLLKKGL